MKLVGRILLLVSGIIFFAVGIWGLVTSTIDLVSNIFNAFKSGGTGIEGLVKYLVAFAISILILIFSIIAGIRGIKSFRVGDHKNANKAFVWAIIILVLNVAGLIYQRTLVPENLTGLIVDAAYVTGAFILRLSKK